MFLKMQKKTKTKNKNKNKKRPCEKSTYNNI